MANRHPEYRLARTARERRNMFRITEPYVVLESFEFRWLKNAVQVTTLQLSITVFLVKEHLRRTLSAKQAHEERFSAAGLPVDIIFELHRDFSFC